MEVKYDINQYLLSIKMSAKTRILVEGKDDKNHVCNLLMFFSKNNKIKIDTAESIRADSAETGKNNRAKLDKIHSLCDYISTHRNFYILRDREYHKFQFIPSILDEMNEHESEGNLSWTIGHSLENYFFQESIMLKAYRFITACEFKTHASDLFSEIFSSALKISSAISVSAKNIGKSSYPMGVISWKDFTITDNNKLILDIDNWNKDDTSIICNEFKAEFKKNSMSINNVDINTARRVGRGHTLMIMLQRIYSACLYHIGKKTDIKKAIEYADEFSKIKESTVAGALGEAWISSIEKGSSNYPVNLVSAVLPNQFVQL
ncbi:hypothetical protein ACPDZI_15430 [Aeromonas oralensis]|uniref:hypothetical protein n=1 Tax=Aeromonas oralensis TaxID=3415010 RepID=UPI003F690769